MKKRNSISLNVCCTSRTLNDTTHFPSFLPRAEWREGFPYDFHGAFNNDYARPRWFARGRTQTQTARHDFLVTRNELTRAASHWLRFRFGSLSLVLLSPTQRSSFFPVPTGRLSVLSSPPCPFYFSLVFPSRRARPVSFSTRILFGSFCSTESILVPLQRRDFLHSTSLS